ncbi:MAG: septum formation initiator [Leifsonia xyli]|nr:MAG: septum formation initiator [Leifsonia xyli]
MNTQPLPDAAASEPDVPSPLGAASPRRPWYRRPLPVACTAAAAVVLIGGTLVLGAPLSSLGSAAASTQALVAGPGQRAPGSSGIGGSFGGAAASDSTVADATTADADESTGVVLIDTELGYQDAAAAGTGMVLTSDGLVLTNNHVIEGSTEITVTVASTGETYTATVVGTDVEDDVALLQLQGASGLATVDIDDDAETVGDDVTAVGNASGGGVLMAADGEITALDTTVTTSAEGSVAGETLDGMIEIVADVVAGDSGGALLDDEGEVVGMTTAASTGTATTVAYAIPIEDALAIVDQILAGDESNGVELGAPAFLGVGIASTQSTSGNGGRSGGSTTTSGATIAGVYADTPAAEAGLEAGDTITAVDGVAVADADALSELLSGYQPGDAVTITWTDTTGASYSAMVTLIAGPAA